MGIKFYIGYLEVIGVKISTKFNAITIGMIATTSLLMFLTLSVLGDISERVDEQQNVNTPVIVSSLSLQKDVVQIQQWLTDISATRGAPGFDDGFDEAEKYYSEAKSELDSLKALGIEDDILNPISKDLDEYYQMGVDMANAYISSGTDAGNKFMEEFDPYAVKMESSVEVLLEEADALVENGNMKISQSISTLIRRAIISFSVILLISIFSFFVSRNVIMKRISNLSGILGDIAEGDGDLTKRVDVSSGDELGIMASYFNTFADTVSRIVSSIKELSSQVVDSSEELKSIAHISTASSKEASHAIEEISRSASNQAEHTEYGARKLSELVSALEESKHQTQNLSSSFKQVNSLVDEGLEVINHLSDTTDESSVATKSVHGDIVKTSESSQKIGEASNLIMSVSEQTNLLALNAAIEAARAGEHGKGFSVVAEEIRKLSIESADSTRIINDIVAELQFNANNAVSTMNRVEEIYSRQIENVHLTESKYKHIRDSLESSNQAILAISESSFKIEQVASEVLDTIQTLSAISEENSAGTEEASVSIHQQTEIISKLESSSVNLSNLSQNLQSLVEQFQV